MQLQLRPGSDQPIYRQMVDSISRDILAGTLEPGYKLPTVRELADRIGVSRGTVKHAYDQLEQMGLIEMTQGRGTFVCERGDGSSKKDAAMELIDQMLDQMLDLSFSFRDIRIFLDLKLREREERIPLVRVAAVDCNPEALAMIVDQLSSIQAAEVHRFLLEDVERDPSLLDRDLDLVVTTANHFSALEYQLPGNLPLMRMALAVSSDTVRQLARLDRNANVGVAAASSNFAAIIRSGCRKYTDLSHDPDVLLLNDDSLDTFTETHDTVILPTDYHQYCGKDQLAVLESFQQSGGTIIAYEYQIDRGSFLYVSEQIERIHTERRP